MSIAIDSALTTEQRTLMFAARDSLIAQLDSAVSRLPGANWLVGQLVRFNLDQALDSAPYLDRALTAATRCRAERWWCTALAGLVLRYGGSVAAADSAFEAVARDLAGPARCTWLDVSALLDADGRKAYAAASCMDREAMASRLWWLAEPLWSAPTHERRVEHYARRVHLALRASLPRDERFNWRLEDGGDAAREMVLRYGWPSTMTWLAPKWDELIDPYVVKPGAPSNGPYTTSEYSWGRIHLVPPWTVLSEPPRLQPMSWYVNLPDSLRVPVVPVRNDTINQTHEFRDAYARSLSWWPVEHYARNRPLVQLADGQVAFLRRDSSIIAAVATTLEPRITGAFAGGYSASLMRSSDPTAVELVSRMPEAKGDHVVVSGDIPSNATLLSLELRGTSASGSDARLRFGATPPSILNTLGANEYAISDPILIGPSADNPSSPITPAVAIESMLGATRIRGTRSVTIYWETYGVAAGDTVTYAIRMERQTRPGALERVAVALRILGDQRASTDVTWTEPDGNHSAVVTGGRVPIQSRTVTLDLAGVQPGTYWLGVSVAKRGSATMIGRRTIVLE